MRFTSHAGWVDTDAAANAERARTRRIVAQREEIEAERMLASAAETIAPTGRHHRPEEMSITMG